MGHANAKALKAIYNELHLASIDAYPFETTFAAEMRLQCALYHYTVREAICYPPAGIIVNPPVVTQLYRMPEELESFFEPYEVVTIPGKEGLALGLGLGIGLAVMCTCGCLAFIAFAVYRKKYGHKGRLIPRSLFEGAAPQLKAGLSRSFTTTSISAGPAPPPHKRKRIKDTWCDRFLDDEGYPCNGHGVQTTADETRYIGQYKDGQPHGIGRMEWPDDTRSFSGSWKKGIPHGQGIMSAQGMETEDEGWIYSGQFKSGQRHGVGRCEWPDLGVWYDGDWQAGSQHGVGEMGSVNQALDDADPMLSAGEKPSEAEICSMDRGRKLESLCTSSFEPEKDSELTYVLLEQSVAERMATAQLAKKEEQGIVDPYRDDSVQVVVQQWGLAIGNPDVWMPGRWGALVVTWIEDNGPLHRWNQAQRRDKGPNAVTILPNAMIWQVNRVRVMFTIWPTLSAALS